MAEIPKGWELLGSALYCAHDPRDKKDVVDGFLAGVRGHFGGKIVEVSPIELPPGIDAQIIHAEGIGPVRVIEFFCPQYGKVMGRADILYREVA